MMNSTIIQTILILAVWVITFVSFAGIGRFVTAILRLHSQDETHGSAPWGDSFWIGWVIVICALQIWHVFFRVGVVFFILTTLLGGACLVYFVLHNRPHLPRGEVLFLLILGGLTGLYLANRSLWYLEPLSGFTQWDTGSYHVQAVKWNTQFPLTLGLANINHYFGFNSNYFLYASYFDFWVWVDRSSYLATGLLLYAMLLQALVGVTRIFSQNKIEARLGLYHGLTLVPLLLKANFVNSLETDLPIFLLMVLLGRQLYQYLLERDKQPDNQLYRVFVITVLVLIGLTIKMNFAMYGLLTLLVVGGTTLIDHRQRLKNWTKTYLPLFAGSFGIIIVPWLARSILISGYPLFPSTALAINVPWRVPAKVAIEEYGHIRTVARVIKPGVDQVVIQGWDWFPAWIREVPETMIKVINLGFIAILTLVIPFPQTSRIRFKWAVFVPILGSIVFWFWMAPAIRFIEGAFWSAALLLACFAVERLEVGANVSTHIFRWLVLAGLFLWMMPFNSPLFITVKSTNWYEYSEPYQPRLIQRRTRNGIRVWTPMNEQDKLRCWNAPLPCVPTLNKSLGSFTYHFAGQVRTGYWLK